MQNDKKMTYDKAKRAVDLYNKYKANKPSQVHQGDQSKGLPDGNIQGQGSNGKERVEGGAGDDFESIDIAASVADHGDQKSISPGGEDGEVNKADKAGDEFADFDEDLCDIDDISSDDEMDA